MHFSVLLSIYYKENSDYLDSALASLVNQTKIPSEIVIVKDGPLNNSLDEVILNYENLYPNLFKIISLQKNQGLGDALNEGLKNCTHEYIARMDSDDICVRERFDIQISFLTQNPDISVTGGFIEEFAQIPGDLKRIKKVPLSYDQIKLFAKKRNPLNHPSVMFRKSAIESLNGYERMLFFEDYYLWLKLLFLNYKIVNLDQVLLYFRTGNDMIGRRHGYKYAVHELDFALKARKQGLFSSTETVRFVLTRFPMRLIPKKMLNFIYRKIIRK